MATLNKTYAYKVYSGATYLGMLQNVTSEFSYNQTINSAGAQLGIELGDAFPDINASLSTNYLVDDLGNHIIDESGNRLVADSTYVFGNLPITLGNRVIVTEYDDENINGSTVFDGLISIWEANYKENKTTITVLGFGITLDNFVIKSGDALQISQLSFVDDGSSAIFSYTPAASYSVTTGYCLVAQTFQPASNYNISKISVQLIFDAKFFGYLSYDTRVIMSVYSGTPDVPGTLLGSVTVDTRPLSTTFTYIDFAFGNPISVISGNNYFFQVESIYIETSSLKIANFQIGYIAGNLYAGGKAWFNKDSNGDGIAEWSDLGGNLDLSFKIYSTAGNVVSPYTSSDTSAIVRDLLDDFNSQGGLISYTDDSIEDSGAIVNYTFNLNTFLEGIDAMYKLAGGGFYWYVDPATNILYFKNTGTTADHTMVLGKHIDNIILSQNLDKIKNTVYFSGGEVAGTNIFRLNQNTNSVNLYGQWLDRISNNRVIDNNTADLISVAEISRYSNPDFVGTLTIIDDAYDIESFNIGEMMGFKNFNNLIDSLLLQIIGIYRYPGSAELALGIITQRNSKQLDELDRRIQALETFNNPDTPT